MRKTINLALAGAFALGAATMFCSCEKDGPKEHDGVLINGVRWATSNVDAPGTFAAKPEDAGMYYQWNRKKAWPATGYDVTDWDATYPTGDSWAAANDPCPTGWRVPTQSELEKLADGGKVSSTVTAQGGMNGRLFTDLATEKSIFLPGAGYRDGNGTLSYVNSFGRYWSATQDDTDYAYCLYVDGGAPQMSNYLSRRHGLVVRCVAK